MCLAHWKTFIIVQYGRIAQQSKSKVTGSTFDRKIQLKVKTRRPSRQIPAAANREITEPAWLKTPTTKIIAYVH